MTSSSARCDHIVALIDACLAEVEAARRSGPATGMVQPAPGRSPMHAVATAA